MNDEGGVWQRGGGAAQVRCRRGCGAGGGGRGQGRPLKNVTTLQLGQQQLAAQTCRPIPHTPFTAEGDQDKNDKASPRRRQNKAT